MKCSRLLASLLFAVAFTQCDRFEKPQVNLEPPEIVLPPEVQVLSPEKIHELIRTTPDLQIIDCRQDHEVADGHFPGAKHINFFRPDEIDEHLAGLDPSKPCLLYCALGTRARLLAVKMHAAKFTDLAILDGGLFAWKKAKLEFPPAQ